MSRAVSATKFAELIQTDILHSTGQDLTMEFLIPRIEKVAILKDKPEIPVDKYILDVLAKAKDVIITI